MYNNQYKIHIYHTNIFGYGNLCGSLLLAAAIAVEIAA